MSKEQGSLMTMGNIYLLKRNGKRLEKIDAESLKPNFPYPIVTMRTIKRIGARNLDNPEVEAIVYQRVAKGKNRGKARILCLGSPLRECMDLVDTLLANNPKMVKVGPICREWAAPSHHLFEYPSVF